ncbi:protein phosphatase 1 regulatory subunit 26 isoform X2 [Rhineura floridana]|uniref:protein phosphatase 1 regulatory subunit 26 isoform X2 n=1 Tax=Rhineura floridana TaxID=261503 RepID=UPI002AC868FF|nr:protein phosphatase 1 regulatory subunit 26 isoform X2 [Rhineura floridana]
MFLMNTPPLVALQRKWEPFAQSRSCRYPVCFSESEDDIARTAVSAKVQMIINNLQSEEASLGSSCSEYGCIVQKKQKEVKASSAKLRTSGRMLQGRIKYAQCNCPADSDGMEVEDASEFGPLLLHSDSDDSVDRDIEEAIQEYLKNKGQSVQSLPSDAKSVHGPVGGETVQEGLPSHDAACSLFPADVEADAVQQQLAPDSFGGEDISSPCSVSSDDSFEQSIKAEIEQFLSEKKQQADKKSRTGGNNQLDQKETQEKLAARSRREGATRGRQSSLKRGGKVLFLRRHPELQGASAPSKTNEELSDFKTTSQSPLKTPLAGRSASLEPSKAGEQKQTFWKVGGEHRLQRAEMSDSSSDDGIEEAIQLYQLEKTRKAAGPQTGHVAIPKEEFRAGGIEDISASLTTHSVKSALPGIPRKALSSKRKQVCSKPAELNKPGALRNKPAKASSRFSPGEDFAQRAIAFQASCRVDTAAELMCAEAILDISKTILPPPMGSDNSRSFATNPLFCSQNVPPSQQESDSNAVDSDDSIEQEIRAFLAVKAQIGQLVTKPERASHAVQAPPSSGPPDGQTASSKRVPPKPLKSLLSHRRKLKGGNKIARQGQDTQLMLSDASQGEGGVSRLESSDTGGATGCQQDTLVAVGSIDFGKPLSKGLLGTGELVKNATRGQQKYGTGDKSSSLDSDEDLDTAIKDLLRSKRKLKKKSKDQRILCKKKVRFSETEMHIFEGRQRDCKPNPPTLLKSCLLSSRRDGGEENRMKGPRSIVKGKPKTAKAVQFAFEFKKERHMKLVSGPEIQEEAQSNQCLWAATSLTDDSSSVDSDDSIEQEIQRFLAEKAKDSTSTMETPGADEIVDTLRVDKPQAAVSKPKQQLFTGGGGALSEQSEKAKEAVPPVMDLRSSSRAEGNASPPSGKHTVLFAEAPCGQVTAKSQASRGVVQTTRAGLPVKRTAGQRKVACDGKVDQRNLPPGKGRAETCKLQNYFKPLSPFKRRSPYEFKISSKFIAGLKSARSKKSVLLGKRQSKELALFKKQGGVLAADLLGKRCEAILQKKILSSGCQAGVREAALSLEGVHPCVTERHEKTQFATSCIVSLAKTKPLEPCCSVDPSQCPPLQGPNIGDGREVKVSTGLLRVEIPAGEEEGKIQVCSTCWEECAVPNSACSSQLKEKSLTDQDRIAHEQTQKVLERSFAEFTDVPVVDCAPCLVKSKASSLCIFIKLLL